MVKPQQRCVFCGEFGLSKEHVWSEWTYELVPKMRDGSHVRGLVIGTPSNPKTLEEFKSYQGNVNTIKVRVVCKHCNNGWMSALENQSKPILTPLIKGETCELGGAEQQILARWIAVKIVVAEHVKRDLSASSSEDRRSIMTGGLDPQRWQIWIGAHRSQTWFRGGYNRQAATLGTIDPTTGVPAPPNNPFRKNTQAVTLGLGQLLFYVVYSRVEGLGELRFTGKLGAALFRVFPFKERIIWPSHEVLTDVQIEQITTAFDRLSATFKWHNAPKP